MYRNRPLTPIGYVVAPLAFWLTRVRPIFDTLWPEPTKYKYRVGGADRIDEQERGRRQFAEPKE